MLKGFADLVTYQWFNLAKESHLADAVNFFVYVTLKIAHAGDGDRTGFYNGCNCPVSARNDYSSEHLEAQANRHVYWHCWHSYYYCLSF